MSDHYHVLLRRNADGVERLCRQDLAWFHTDGSGAEFWWTEGNMRCDCARAQEFATAGGEVDPDIKCSRGLYTAVKAILPDGREIPLDGVDRRDPKLVAFLAAVDAGALVTAVFDASNISPESIAQGYLHVDLIAEFPTVITFTINHDPWKITCP